eukprot:Plantae.Rhodophyta-Hildenbrandia_rubra.ctg4775.p1 GENE.Plantae.Rhodophyta-Hildenbrandia_rubra.ctg4775~~Plantae.Rhodophyta-Hildenbrandia_rubra.ctg4775.p1  ORF type:complete len:373 (+),score=58.25 Plantae.Rhodophyta-Hildenbrandia_rubra.ctg4775:164-1282(+)
MTLKNRFMSRMRGRLSSHASPNNSTSLSTTTTTATANPASPSSTADKYIQKLLQFIKDMNRPPLVSFRDGFTGEFDSLYEEDRIRCHRNPDLFRTSALPENIWRNRYQGIDANEATRVKLKRVPPGESNFINANHIPGDPPEKGGYIATQAPVCETMGHFWQMVHEQRVCVILMLTREREDRYDNLSERYWPKTGRKISFEGVEVFGMGKKSHKDVGIWERSFVVRLVGDDVVEEEDVKVVQLQFMSWPDHAIPASTECLLTLRKMVRKFSWDTGFNEDGDLTGRPIVVHCSAGIGRTGTYIAVDIALHRIEIALKEGADLDHDALRLDAIRDIVRYLKAQRSRMVQNPQQYRYIFDCVLDGTRELASGMSR